MNASLNYSSKKINGTFKIKVYGVVNGKKVNTLVGVSGLVRMLDGSTDLINRLLDRAFRCQEDVCHCKLRRGVKVSFYCY